jgi:hypothetical protein
MLDIERFFARSPTLYHMARVGAWPQIERHGLLSVRTLLDLSQKSERERTAIAVERKTSSVSLDVPLVGTVLLRDQGVLNSAKLQRALNCSMPVEDWVTLLDSRVFLWAKPESLEGLVKAKSYRRAPQTIIEVDSRTLFEGYRREIEVADINTGAVLHRPAARGSFTFQSIDEYRRVGRREVVEVTVVGGIPDIARFVKRVVHRKPDGQELKIFHRVFP